MPDRLVSDNKKANMKKTGLRKETGEKLEELKLWFDRVPGVIVAFSGGVDSSLLLYLARQWKGREAVIAVLADSESLKRRDREEAQEFSRRYDIRMEIIHTRELEDERYSSNPIDRCFFCKEHLYGDLGPIRDRYPGYEVLNGTNVDDHSDHRPGHKAADAFSVLSPMADAGIDKKAIRELAAHFALPNHGKPASPCLSSRIPYAQQVTRQKLLQIEAAEDLLNRLGFEDVRVRHYGDHGRVEVPHDEVPRLLSMETEVEEGIRAVGFERVEIDPEGLVSGKMNRVIGNAGTGDGS